jgi:hypothetical protein
LAAGQKPAAKFFQKNFVNSKMKPSRPDAGGITIQIFSRHQVRIAATGSARRPEGNSRLCFGLTAASQPEAGVGESQFPALRNRPSKVPAALSVTPSNLSGRRQPMRQAVKNWRVAPAHAAGKTLVVACAASS